MKKFALPLLMVVSIQCFSQTGLFVHTDKSVYTPNERIYFTGYIISSRINVDTFDVMYVVLSGNNKVITKRYIMTDGISTGNIEIPDSFSNGQYNLIAYVDKYLYDTDEGFYKQTISIIGGNKEGPSDKVYDVMSVRKSVFVHMDSTESDVGIELDSVEYNKSSLVRVALHTGTSAIVSVSCVFAGRVDVRNIPNINRFIMNQSLPRRLDFSEPDSGCVMLNNKRLKRGTDLAIFGNMINPVRTDKRGRFAIPTIALHAKEGKDIRVAVSGSDPIGYKIILWNRYEERNKEFLGLPLDSLKLKKIDTADSDAIRNAQGKTLGGVIVKADLMVTGWGKRVGMGCPDWVCQYNILNCRNHPSGRKPIVGEEYTYRECKTCYFGGKYKYTGCTVPEVPLVRKADVEPVYLPSLSDPFLRDVGQAEDVPKQTNTTLIWLPIIITTRKGYGEFEFYTNDIKGLYYIIVQGIGANGPISIINTLKIK